MSESSIPNPPVMRFGAYEVDRQARELRKRGRKIRLQDKPFELLIALLENPGQVVTRAALREKLWPNNTFVDFDHGLNNAVNRLRESLCDSADRPALVETVPRRGYRFIGSLAAASSPQPAPDQSEHTAQPVAEPASLTSEISLPNPDTQPPADRSRSSVGKLVLGFCEIHWPGLAVSAGVLLLGTVTFLWWFTQRRSVEVPRIDSIAVLPLEDLASGSSDNYFADGMTEELITELAKRGSLRVISRTSVMRYRKADQSLTQIGHELNVNALIEGTVRRSGQRVRITVQLLRASPEQHLWADSYEGDIADVLNLQRNVAKDIADRIGAKLASNLVANSSGKNRPDPDAYENYLRGRYFLAKRSAESMKKAVEYFKRAAERDPQYAPTYGALAVAYDLLGIYEMMPPNESLSRVKQFATQALALDGTLAEAYTARALASSMWELDWPAAERDFKHAIALEPNSALAHHWYGEHLINLAQRSRAVSELRRARELDPLSLPVNGTLGRIYSDAGRFEEGVQQCKNTIELDPHFAMGHWCLGRAYMGERKYSAAISAFEEANTLGTTPLLICDLGFAYARTGERTKAIAMLNMLRRKANSTYVPPYLIAVIYGALGNKNQAFQNLERALAERDSHITYLPVDTDVDSLRSDPRFSSLMRRLQLPN